MNAHDPSHSIGQHVDNVDQLGSVTLLGIALIGAAFTLLLNWLVIG